MQIYILFSDTDSQRKICKNLFHVTFQLGNEYFENLLAVHLWFGTQPGRLSDSLAHKLSDKPLRNLWYIVVHILSGKQFHKLAH